ncbi:MAG TPA: AAA family ATPase [Kofleriaceae bacterium]
MSDQMRRLMKKWAANSGWPKRLEWIEIFNLRGWAGQRIEFACPIMAIVGENGSGKSTILQSAACVYRSDERDDTMFASDFFPDTAWDRVGDAAIAYGYQEGMAHHDASIRKPTSRWLGNVDRPIRAIEYIDLSRTQPVAARVGYAKIAKTRHEEKSAAAFDDEKVKRLSEVMGREYDGARMALSSLSDERQVPVITKGGINYSGFHQGSGETTIVELLQADLPKYGLVLIDEIESSLHPRAQRRLMRELAEICRLRELQIILTTHSPYVLEELPLEARMYIMETQDVKRVMSGISPQFAMTKMDDKLHPECDLYVEDNAAKTMLAELLARHAPEAFVRCDIIPYGAVNVGHALGQMVQHHRFNRPSRVFLDGDSAEAPGCTLLPGVDAPERVVFGALRRVKWEGVWTRIARDYSLVVDVCTQAMILEDHHEWARYAATQLRCGGDTLWQAMCAEWAKGVTADDIGPIVQTIEDALG